MEMTTKSQIRAWFERPLSRRQSASVYCAVPTFRIHMKEGPGQAVIWALGSIADGESEVLGAWLCEGAEGVAVPSVFAELRARGAEFIRFGVGDAVGDAASFRAVYPRGQALASVEQTLEALAARVPASCRLALLSSLRAAADAESLSQGRAVLAGSELSRLGERYPELLQLAFDALARWEPLYGLSAPQRRLIRRADRTAAEVRGRLNRAILRHGPFRDSGAALEFVALSLARAEQGLDRARALAMAAREGGKRAGRSAEGGGVGHAEGRAVGRTTMGRTVCGSVPVSGSLGVPTLA